MIGMNANTGGELSGIAHITQSIAKILSTPIGSRLARREFGSEIADLIDAPNNSANRLRLYAATAGAIMRWEPRVRLTRVFLSDDAATPGATTIDIDGINTETGEQIATSVPLAQGAAQ